MPPELTGKSQGRDLERGNLTLPLRLFLDTLPENQQNAMFERMAAGPLEPDELADICAAVQRAGLEGRIAGQVKDFLAIAEHSLERLPGSPEKQILGQIIVQVSSSVRGEICLQN